MIHGKIDCPACGAHFEISLTKAPAQQSAKAVHASTDGLGELLERIDDDKLRGKSAEFVAKTRERFEQYGAKTLMSEPQMKWLRDIADEQESGQAF